MFNHKNKKADTHMWWIIVAAIMALVVVVFLLIWFKSGGEKAFGSINQNIAGVGDCDGDKAADMFDKCPCDAEESAAKVSGCPASVKDSNDALTKKKVGDPACTCINSPK